MNFSLSPAKLLVAGMLVTAAAGGGVLASHQASPKPEKITGSGTQVLGEKSARPDDSSTAPTGSGSSSSVKPTNSPSGGGDLGSNGGGGSDSGGALPAAKPASPSNGNTGGNDNKSFTIVGQLADDLEPGSATQITLSVTNTTNQTISVDTLGAAFDHVVAAAGRSGCTVANAGLTVGSWSGGSFTVAKGATTAAPGAVPVSMSSASNTGCQGAQLWFHFTGTATK